MLTYRYTIKHNLRKFDYNIQFYSMIFKNLVDYLHRFKSYICIRQ